MKSAPSIPKLCISFARSKFNPSVGVITEYNLFPPLTEGSEFGKGVGFLGEDRDIMSDMTRGVPFVDVYDPETGGKECDL